MGGLQDHDRKIKANNIASLKKTTEELKTKLTQKDN